MSIKKKIFEREAIKMMRLHPAVQLKVYVGVSYDGAAVAAGANRSELGSSNNLGPGILTEWNLTDELQDGVSRLYEVTVNIPEVTLDAAELSADQITFVRYWRDDVFPLVEAAEEIRLDAADDTWTTIK